MAQTRIERADIHEGVRYSAPLFFDDGQCMFLAEGKPVKAHHIQALDRWKIPFVVTYGHELSGPADGTGALDDVEELEEL
ncbi:MAG: phosphohydrolase [Treponema sp.]|nr:phosphohydrolase [Treponema sp.]